MSASKSLFVIQSPRVLHVSSDSKAGRASFSGGGEATEFKAEHELRELLRARQIPNIGWYGADDGKSIMAVFSVNTSDTESLLESLGIFGYGSDFGTVNLLPTTLAKVGLKSGNSVLFFITIFFLCRHPRHRK